MMWALLPATRKADRRFDLFGFSMLALGLAALQLMLDRGAHEDWFNSVEIWIECGIAIACLRSEEHTSELQSLMRISYAVFCLQKNNHTTQLTEQHYL